MNDHEYEQKEFIPISISLGYFKQGGTEREAKVIIILHGEKNLEGVVMEKQRGQLSSWCKLA